MINAVIIEDDAIWRNKIFYLLEEIHVNIIDIATSLEEVVYLFKKNSKPDLIIADICLGDKLFFEAYQEFPDWLNVPCILLTTSSNETHYKQALQIKQHLYIVKPMHLLTLKSCIDVLCHKTNNNNNVNGFLPIKGSRNELINLPFSHILYIEQDGNYCTIFTATKQFVLKKSLTKVMTTLSNKFLLIRRSICVNVDNIENFANNLHHVKLKGGIELPIGRLNKEKVKQYLAEKAIST